MFERKSAVITIITVIIVFLLSTASFAAFTCGNDYDNDGDITDPGETADCVLATDGSNFCPLDSAECVIMTNNPTCPDGTTLNTATNRCETAPSCAQGNYNTTMNFCVMYTDAVCPASTTLNTQTDKCETSPNCDIGSYDPLQDMCIDMTTRTCPANTIVNPNTGKCEAEPVCIQGTYNQAYNACVVTGTTSPSCYDGLTLNAATDKCEAAPNCYPGAFDATSDLCIGSVNTSPASCPQDTTINLTRDVCEGQAKCTANTVFNSTTKLCEAAPVCAPGSGNYDKSIDLCKTPGSQELFITAAIIYANWKGWTCEKEYNPQKIDYCTPQLIYDETVWKVDTILHQLEIGAFCPTGTALDQATLKCAQHPFCPDGTTLDILTNTCIATPFCSQGLYDIFLDQCVIIYNDTFVPICPAGTTELDTVADRCASPVQCPDGTMFNPTTDKCETEIGCASGVYDPSRNYCVLGATTLCPDGAVFNVNTEKCEAPFSCPANTEYDSALQACSYGTVPFAPYCPSPGSYNGFWNHCQYATYVWNGCQSPYSLWYYDRRIGIICTTSASCLGKGTLTNDQCVPYPSVTPSCPSGTVFNATSSVCQANPSCPAGSAYDPVMKTCSTVVNPVCVAGTNINTDRDLCETVPACVSGNSFNPSSDRCESIPQCPWGSFYDMDRDTCVKNNGFTAPVCPKDTVLNAFTDWCEGGLLCSPGATYNPATKQCEAMPTCATGDLKFTTFDWASTAPGYQYAYCDIPSSTTASSCVANTTLDTDLDMCTAPTQCPSGTFFNNYTLWCEAVPNCPSDSYYYPSLGICVATANTQPTCPSGARFNGTTDLCEQQPICSDGRYDSASDICDINKILSVTCPWGTVPNGSTGKCEGGPQCEFGGIYDSKLDKCIRKTVATCVTGTSLNRSADLCEGSPTCQPNMGTYDTIINQCVLATAAQCPPQGYLNRATDMCEAVPGCSTGSYDPATSMCQSTGGITSPAQCLSGTQLDEFYDKCTVAPTCAQGTYNAYFDKCTAPVSCSSGSFNTLTDVCDLGGGATASPTCPSGMTLDGVTDVCVSHPTCLSGTTMDTGIDKCVVYPTCAPGAGLYDAAQDVCVSYEKMCPLNTADKTYTCVDVGGVEKCSINTCFDPNSPLPPDSSNNLTNDGPVDPNSGQCLGQIYIFNGQSQRCLRPGQRTLTADCCSMPIPEDIYNEVSNPYNRFQRTVVDPLHLMSTDTLRLLTDYLGIFQGGCDMNEMLLNIAMKDKRTHYVGEWCLVKWLNWCVQKAQMHCIFNSTLARIINEQGRPQLKRFGPDGGWGTPEQPDCSGFTFDEFQMLDFSRIDLSEFVDLIQARVVQDMQDTIGDTVSDFYDQTLPSFNPQ